jgi:hypothetical protein
MGHRSDASPVGARRFDGWDWPRLLRHGYIVFALAMSVVIISGHGQNGMDGRAYWLSDLSHLYGLGSSHDDAFLYSPAFAEIVAPLTNLPWGGFLALLTMANLAALWYLLGPWALPMLLFPVVSIELLMANINLLIAVAIVAGFRRPYLWGFVLLTKVTPGVGLLWFLVRREWRSLGIALGATLAVMAVSAVIAPHLWAQWFGFLATAPQPITSGPDAPWQPPVAVPLLVRLPIAATIVVYGALTDRPQCVPIAAAIAQPVIWGWTIMLGALPLMDWHRLWPRRPEGREAVAGIA